jgi:hypothetical protein
MGKTFPHTSLTMVVARYKENISWVPCLGYKFVIYNKGPKLGMPCIELPNIGREAHSYLYYIVSNYDKLTDFTAFLQGHPFDHCSNINCIFRDFPTSLDRLYKYCNGLYGIADRFLEELDVDIHKIHVYPDVIYKEFFAVDYHKFHFAGGAQYIVHKNNILNKPWQFYFDLLNYYSWTEHEPWSMERLWPQIFDAEDKYKHKLKNLGK